MPKATIDKYRNAFGWEREIGRANELSCVKLPALDFVSNEHRT